MAERRLKTKVVAPAARDAAAGVALVGTYRARQLAWMAREGVYNWPVKDGDAFDAAALGKVGELWLYADAKGTRHAFAATFAGRMTRAAFLAAHPSYASRVGAPTHTAYYVFKTTPLGYGPGLENPVVLVRAGDFGPRTAKARRVRAARTLPPRRPRPRAVRAAARLRTGRADGFYGYDVSE